MSFRGAPPRDTLGRALPSNTELIKRLLLLSWTYRRGCASVLSYQVVLLCLGLWGLGLTGLAIDLTRHALDPAVPAPHWPLGMSPAAGASPMSVIGIIGGAVLVMAALRALLNYLYAVAV
jgi:ATP-binding cassette, subfamily B, bacterial